MPNLIPLAMRPYAASFAAIAQRLQRSPGFVLLPIEVPGPDVAQALVRFLQDQGHSIQTLEPGDDPEAWKHLPAMLIQATKFSPPPTAIVLIAPTEAPLETHAGLRFLNQRRDAVVHELKVPLLWCASADFLDQSWQEAPDFWSIRTTDIRIGAASQRAPSPATETPAMPEPKASKIDKLRTLYRDAHSQGALAVAARFAAQLIDHLLQEGSPDAFGEAEQVLNEAVASSAYSQSKGNTGDDGELKLRRGEVDIARGRTLSAAATLGALLERGDLDNDLRARAALRMGRLLEDNGDTGRALAMYLQALEAARKSNNLEQTAHALISAAQIEARTEEMAQAQRHIGEAVGIAQRLRDPALQAQTEAARALLAIAGRDQPTAQKRLERAQQLQEQAPQTTTGREPWAGPAARVDVLILVALQDELSGLLGTNTEGQIQNAWDEQRDLGGFRYYRRTLQSNRSEPIRIAAAWIGEMGQRSAAIRGQQLLSELEPTCLAMCGICAGYKEKTSLGDIILAERLYAYFEGKRIAHAENGSEERFHTLKSFDLEAIWKMDASFLAREIDLSALERERPPTQLAQRRWLLHTLFAHEQQGGPPPQQHPDRKRACPGWSQQFESAVREGLIRREGGALRLTDQGRDFVLEDQLHYPDGPPPDPPLRIHLGALATVGAVTEDPKIFSELRRIERNTLGLEMEGTAISELAERFQKRVLVVKAVQDFADGSKDDAFRAFGCKASAWFLLHFLARHFQPEVREPIEARRLVPAFEMDMDGRIHPFLKRVERLMDIRCPGAKITLRLAPSPFAGLLEIEREHHGVYEAQLIVALDQAITPEAVTLFLENILPKYRQRDPYLRATFIHTGERATQPMIEETRRHGIVLQQFYEAQGLFDLRPYLEQLARRLSSDDRYLPSTYVTQAASIELSGNRERRDSDDILQFLWQLFSEENQPRFALVLGEFGAGKTFLLRELCRRMIEERHPVWPVLVEMGQLEKQHSLKELMAAHFGNYDLAGYSYRGFEYLLHEGRIALFFDGFDEMALRVDYGSATEHLKTVLQAVQGHAKVLLSSRRQHFLTDGDLKEAIKLEMARKAEEVQGYRLIMLRPFEEKQIRSYLRNVLGDEKAAEERYRLIHDVKDLMGLSENPRMLSFIAKLPEGKLREAKKEKGEIRSADLYEILVKDWLDFEYRRSHPKGGPHGLNRGALEMGIGQIAHWLWHEHQKDVDAKKLEELLGAVAARGGKEALDVRVVAHMFGAGSLLVRDRDADGGQGRFSFVHRSVMEWFLAKDAAEVVKGQGSPVSLEADEISPLMADFFSAQAGRDAAVAWARRVLQGEKQGYGKRNATLVLKRLKVPLEQVNLEGQDLRGRDFSGVDWRGANLRGANLRGATLVGADLEGADLRGANLSRANLEGANLCGAELDGVDLSFARAMRVDLTGARSLETVKWMAAKLLGAKGEIESDEWQSRLQTWGAAPPLLFLIQAMVELTTGESKLQWRGGPRLAHSPNGNLLAWVRVNFITIYDSETGLLLRVISGHLSNIRALAWSPVGSVLASASSDKTIKIWDIHSGRCVLTLHGHQDQVLTVAFSPNGSFLVSASLDDTAKLWDTKSGDCILTFSGHQHFFRFVTFNPDGSSLASTSSDNTAKIWDIHSGQYLLTFSGHQGIVNAVTFNPAGSSLASASSDNTAKIWDVRSTRCLFTLKGHQNLVTAVAFSPNGSLLASASRDGKAKIWNTRSGQCLYTLEGHQNTVLDVSFHPNGLSLASDSEDNTIKVWDVHSAQCLLTIKGHHDSVVPIAFHQSGSVLASACSDKTTRMWNTRSGQYLLTLKGHQSSVRSVAFKSDGSTLASASDDDTAKLWDVGSGNCLLTLKGHEAALTSVAFNPNGSTLASASRDGTAKLWHVRTGKCILTLSEHQSTVYSVAFSHDGSDLVSASEDKTAKLWDTRKGRCFLTLTGHQSPVNSVTFNHDSSAIASGSDDSTAKLWDAHRGQCLLTLKGHQSDVNSVAFNPDGSTLASASRDGTAKLWSTRSGECLLTLQGHTHSVNTVAFNPTGTRLITSSYDGTIRFWSIRTGECLAIILPLSNGWVAYRPRDGRYRAHGDLEGRFFHSIGLCRFEPGELDPYLPTPLALTDNEPLIPDDW